MGILKVSLGVRPGNYTATFEGCVPQPPNALLGYGPGLRWTFTIVTERGPQVGETVSRVTGLTPSPNNACGKILSGLLGREIQEDEEIDPDLFKGRKYLIIVEPGQNGATRVASVVPAE